MEIRIVHATLFDRNIHLHIRIMHRKFLERVYLPAAGITINRSAPVHVLELRYADRLLRQHPDCKLSVAQGALPSLPDKIFPAISNG